MTSQAEQLDHDSHMIYSAFPSNLYYLCYTLRSIARWVGTVSSCGAVDGQSCPSTSSNSDPFYRRMVLNHSTIGPLIIVAFRRSCVGISSVSRYSYNGCSATVVGGPTVYGFKVSAPTVRHDCPPICGAGCSPLLAVQWQEARRAGLRAHIRPELRDKALQQLLGADAREVLRRHRHVPAVLYL